MSHFMARQKDRDSIQLHRVYRNCSIGIWVYCIKFFSYGFLRTKVMEIRVLGSMTGVNQMGYRVTRERCGQRRP